MAKNKKQTDTHKQKQHLNDKNGSDKAIKKDTTNQEQNDNNIEIRDGNNQDALHEEIARLKLQLDEKNKELDQKNDIVRESQETTKKQEKHTTNAEVEQLLKELEQMKQEKETIETQYDTLLSKLSSMKAVFSKMKEAQTELERCKEVIEKQTKEMEDQKKESEKQRAEIEAKKKLLSQLQHHVEEIQTERDRLNLTLIKTKRELQEKTSLAEDEKYMLENNNSKLSRKLQNLRSEFDTLVLLKNEAEMQTKTLNDTLDDLSEQVETRKAEVESLKVIETLMTEKLAEKEGELNRSRKEHESTLHKLKEELEEIKASKQILSESLQLSEQKSSSLEQELKKIPNLESEINNKQLIVGKLRHEAVILNEHLTKALTMLKQQLSSLRNAVDRELISNLFISFLQFPRGDTKKFETLQLISALLEWDQEQRVNAGLSHRTSSTSNQGNEERPRQSFVSLWTDFLERESTSRK